MRTLRACVSALLFLVALALPSRGHAFQTVRIATGLSQPTFLAAAPGDANRLFILEKAGRIRILKRDTGLLNGAPFLDLSGPSTPGECGLLGLAFHPNYASNGFFYVQFTADNAGVLTTTVRRYTMVVGNPDAANAASRLDLMTIIQTPASNHKGGWIGFGPDAYLYIALGDGGGANDEGTGHTAGTGNAQDLTDNLFGKMLRINVDSDGFPADATKNYAIPADNPFVGATGDDEIFAYGLRNPFRASFDRQTFDLYIADVGQSEREEVNVAPAGAAFGANYGWRLREGMIQTPGVGGPKPAGAIDPIHNYGRSFGVSITGGYVYRGPITELRGAYFFADWGLGGIKSLRFNGAPPASHNGTNYTDFVDWRDGVAPDITPTAGTINMPSSFGEDNQGNLFIVDYDGEIFMLQATSTAAVPALPRTGFIALALVLALSGLVALGFLRRRSPA